MTIAFPLRFHREDEGGYWFQGLPPYENVLGEGATLAQARLMAAEALSGVLEVMLDSGQPVPRPVPAGGNDVVAIAPEPAVCQRLQALWGR